MMLILSSKLRFYRCAPSEYYVTFDLTVSRAHFLGSTVRYPLAETPYNLVDDPYNYKSLAAEGTALALQSL
jgi:hypothetical protein